MKRKAPRATFDTPSRSILVEPIVPPEPPAPLPVSPAAGDDARPDDDPRRASA